MRYRRFADPLGYYEMHYPGMTRTALCIAETSVYQRLAKDGLLDKIPRRVAANPDPLREYQTKYPGVTRG